LPVELLTTIFELLPKSADVAAAARVCRFWAQVGSAVLWRSPRGLVLRRLPAAARGARCAAHVSELSLVNLSDARLFATPLPRSTSLHVSLTVVLRHTERFCRFVLEHSGAAGEGGRGGGNPSSSTGNSTGSGRSAVMYTSSSTAAGTSRVLTTVQITTDKKSLTQTLPTEAFVVIASCPWLRQFDMAASELTMEAVQKAITPGNEMSRGRRQRHGGRLNPVGAPTAATAAWASPRAILSPAAWDLP
jgi:hypothetical protein